MERIRNVCILAHVDHGKTTLADNLLYSSGIISKHSAGDLRHLDSTQDEQERGITMKSSCITLRHIYKNKLKSNQEAQNYVINLIDSPGHVDFSGEVSTAVKISDNAFIIVDVVEGVSPQTRTVIQQAWKERLNFILVLNKIDKMYSELKLDSMSAYKKLDSIIMEVHHIIGELISFDVQAEEERTDSILSAEYINEHFDTNPFNPLKLKVVFCSAYHQWGFRISDFVMHYSELLQIDKLRLFRKMWGDFYINSKKVICNGAADIGRKNIFTNLIIDQIWNVYSAFESNDIDKVTRMMAKLGYRVDLKTKATDLSSQIDNIRTAFRQWMPLPTSLLDALVEMCPSPKEAMDDKKVALLVPNERFERARSILKTVSPDRSAPTVAFISKFMFQSRSHNDLIGLGRIYSGQALPNMKMFLFTQKFNPFKVAKSFLTATPDDFEEGFVDVYEQSISDKKHDSNAMSVIRLRNVYQFIGDDQILLKDGAPAGNVVGFTGFDGQNTYKSVTLAANCTLEDCLGMFSSYENASSDEISNIICVSVEPEKVTYINELRDALYLLEKADPIVNVSISSTGEMLVHAAGEIHLEKCLNQLTTRIAPHIAIQVSDPIVQFRETALHRAMCDLELHRSITSLSQELKMLNTNIDSSNDDQFSMTQHQGIKDSMVIYIRLPQKTGTKLSCSVSVHTLPPSLVDWIDKNSITLSQMQNAHKTGNQLSKSDMDHLHASVKIALEAATNEEREMCNNTDIMPIDFSALLSRLSAIGNSHETKCNMLFSYVDMPALFSSTDEQRVCPFAHSIMKGFQQALKDGPICQESMKNLAFIVHNIWESFDETPRDSQDNGETGSNSGVSDNTNIENDNSFDSMICVPGQMSALISKACQVALMSHPGVRLMIAMYKLDLEVRIANYKPLDSLIHQLHGNIVKQEVNLGNFVVEARLPVIESFKFGEKLRKKTSGEVGLPQLKTILWEVLDCSPLLDMNLYKTISDRADNCDIGISSELVARTQKYVNVIRRRKGIQVRKQLIESGDKQRTLNKKK